MAALGAAILIWVRYECSADSVQIWVVHYDRQRANRSLPLFICRTSEHIYQNEWSAVNEPLFRFRRDLLIQNEMILGPVLPRAHCKLGFCPHRCCHLDIARAGWSHCRQTGSLRITPLWFVCLWWKRAEQSRWDVMRQAKCCGCWISLLMWHNHSSEWPRHLSNRYTLYRVCSLFYLCIYSGLWSLVIDMPDVISHPAAVQEKTSI